MKIKTQNTKNLRTAFDLYKKSENFNIWQAYDKPSYAKEKAFSYCKNLQEQHNGNGLKIISKNTFVFSAGFTFENENGQKIFCYITPSKNSYMVI